jgi:hypothetical protein
MATLPSYVQILFDGYNRTRESALLRTEMEYGPPKQAKIKSKVMITSQVNLYFDSKANFQSFETWYDETLDEGSGWFDMTDPVSGNTISARFVGGGYKAKPMSANMEQWQLAAELEYWS